MKYLIADDDPVSRLALSYLIADLPNSTVVQVEDGQLAWQVLEAMNEPVICLLDNRMPGLSGVDVLKKMRLSARYIGWPVMLITSTADRSLVSDAVQFGISGFVLKPVAEESLSRITEVANRFEASILAPFSETAARLEISQEQYQKYIQALLKQLEVLAVALQNVTVETLSSIKQRAETCHSAALTLGSKPLDLIFEKLIPSLDSAESLISYASFSDAISLARNRIEHATSS